MARWKRRSAVWSADLRRWTLLDSREAMNGVFDFPFHVDSSDLFSFEHIEPSLEGKLAHNHSS